MTKKQEIVLEPPVAVIVGLAATIADGWHERPLGSWDGLSDAQLSDSLVLAELIAEQLRAETRYRASGHRPGSKP